MHAGWQVAFFSTIEKVLPKMMCIILKFGSVTQQADGKYFLLFLMSTT